MKMKWLALLSALVLFCTGIAFSEEMLPKEGNEVFFQEMFEKAFETYKEGLSEQELFAGEQFSDYLGFAGIAENEALQKKVEAIDSKESLQVFLNGGFLNLDETADNEKSKQQIASLMQDLELGEVECFVIMTGKMRIGEAEDATYMKASIKNKDGLYDISINNGKAYSIVTFYEPTETKRVLQMEEMDTLKRKALQLMKALGYSATLKSVFVDPEAEGSNQGDLAKMLVQFEDENGESGMQFFVIRLSDTALLLTEPYM